MPWRIAVACLLLFANGCKAREMGVAFAPNQSATVDDSWATAVQRCWPDVAHQGFSKEGLKHNLADPLHFRAAFGAYASLTDADIEIVVKKPVLDAPTPDTTSLQRSPTPVLTRFEAVTGDGSNPNRNEGMSSGELPQDAFCAIHNGSPVGFK